MRDNINTSCAGNQSTLGIKKKQKQQGGAAIKKMMKPPQGKLTGPTALTGQSYCSNSDGTWSPAHTSSPTEPLAARSNSSMGQSSNGWSPSTLHRQKKKERTKPQQVLENRNPNPKKNSLTEPKPEKRHIDSSNPRASEKSPRPSSAPEGSRRLSGGRPPGRNRVFRKGCEAEEAKNAQRLEEALRFWGTQGAVVP